MLDFRIILTIAVKSTTAPYRLISNGTDSALDMINNNIYIKKIKLKKSPVI